MTQRIPDRRAPSGCVAIGALALGLAGAFSAAAQQPAQAPAAPAPGSGRQLDINVSGQVVYDDNVGRSGANVASRRNVSRTDNIYTAGAQIQAAQPFGRQVLFGSGNISYDWYQKNTRLDRSRIVANGGVGGALGPCIGSVSGGYARGLTSLEDEIDLIPAVVTSVRETRSVNGAITCGRPRGFAVQATGGRYWVTNELVSRRESDNDGESAQAGLMYRRPTFGELGVFGQYSRVRYPNRLAPPSFTVVDGYESVGGGVSYKRAFGRRLKVTTNVLFQHLTPNVKDVPAFDGWSGGGSVEFSPMRRLAIIGTFDRSVSASGQGSTSYQLARSYGLSVRYSLGRNVDIQLSGSRQNQNRRGASLDPARFITEQNIKSYSALVGYKLGKRITFQLTADHVERDANVPGFSYVGNRYGIRAAAGF